MRTRGLSSRCVWPVLCLAVAGLVAGGISARDAIGQERGGFSFAGPAGLGSRSPSVTTIVMSASARQEVGINPEQQAQIDKLVDERRRSISVDLGAMPTEERLSFIEKQQADMEAKLKTILTPDQYTRLQQIAWHRSGPAALRTEPLATEFRLTEDQKSQFDTIRDEQRQSAREMIRLSPEERTKFRADYDAKYMAMLTPDQQERWKEKIGPAPEEPPPPPTVNPADKRDLLAQKSALLKEALDEASAGQKSGRVSPLEVLQAEDQYLASTLFSAGSSEKRLEIHTKLVELATTRVDLVKKNVDKGRMSAKDLREAKLALIERKLDLYEAAAQLRNLVRPGL